VLFDHFKTTFIAGNFSQSKVSLSNNQLNKMEAQVFLSMLQDMKTSGVGILSVDYSNNNI